LVLSQWFIRPSRVPLSDSPSVADNPMALAEETGKMSADGLIGAKLAIPVMPLAVFAESRCGVIFTDNRIQTLAVEGGVMLDF